MGSSPAYPSDLTDEQWALMEPMVPVLSTRGRGTRGGRPPKYPRRRIVEAILYLDRTGCSWRQLPHDFPPWDTVYSYFQRWAADGTTDRIHDALRAAVRDADGRDPLASAGAMDSQTVPGASTVGKDTRGWDAGKKTNGRKRHLVVDTLGLLIVVLVTAASVQDRDGAIRVLDRAKMVMPSLVLVWADAAYSRRAQDFAARALGILVQVVAKLVGQRGFVPLPRRWVVERTHAWITGHRRMSRDYERLTAHSEAMIKWAMIGLMARRLAPASGRRPWQPTAARTLFQHVVRRGRAGRPAG
jgi:transposase